MLRMLEQQPVVNVIISNKAVEMTSAEVIAKINSGEYKIDCIKAGNPLTIVLKSEEYVIKSATIVDSLTHLWSKKDKGLTHIQITLDVIKEGNQITPNNKVGFVKIPENLGIRKGVFNLEDSIQLRHGKTTMTFTKDSNYPATLQILSLSYGGDEEQAKYLIKYGLFFKISQFGNYKFYMEQGGILYNIENNEDILTSKEGLSHYLPFGASPSNDRQKVLYMIDVTNGPERAHAILNELTYGAYNVDFGKEVDYNTLAKASTRWFQWMAPSCSLGTVERIAVYDGKFNKDKFDGMCFSSSEAQASKIYTKFGHKVDPNALDGVFFQCRPAQLKAGSVNTKERYLWAMISHLDPNPIVLNWDEVDEQFNKDMASGKYKGRVVILGSGTLEFLVDKNVLKSNYDYRIKPEYTVLRFLRSNRSNFSATIFQKMLAKDEERATAFASKLFSKEVISKVNRVFIDPKPRVLSPDNLTGDFYMDEVVQSIFPTYMNMDKNLSINALDNITTGTNKMLEKSKVPMTGKNAGLTVGIENMFDVPSFLNDHEVFTPAAERIFKDESLEGQINSDRKIFMIKYPSMDINEYMVATSISFKELKSRIKAANISKEMKEMFINYYSSLHDSVIVVPACELFKHMLAGSDFDTDQVCWAADKELIEVLENDVPVAVVIED